MLFKIKAAIFLIAISVGQALAQGEINGKVIDQDGNPLSGAHIVVNKTLKSTFSQSDGRYASGKLKPGEYDFTVSFIGYEDYSQLVEVGASPVEIDVVLKPSPFMTDEVVVEATRVSREAPVTAKNIEKKEIEDLNLGQDIPVLLKWTPSMVTTSDAGAGVGYTGLRIRGSDQTRINVTLNGIPMNDPEGHGVFWVNTPDLATSLSGVQIQRGLGSSTNGSGAFGASINLETSVVDDEPKGLISNSFGSFNTQKHTAQYSSGRMENGFAVEGRLSHIQSDGYIDRAASNLNSYFFQAGYYGEKTVIKALTLGGHERTYQSWYGTPESRVKGDVDEMNDFADRNYLSDADRANLLNSGRTYNYYTYQNQVDDYSQDFYQLHWIQEINPNLELTMAGHYTDGAGYFEEYKPDDSFDGYGLSDQIIGMDTISSSDIIRRRWLDNDYYGGTFALKYDKSGHKLTWGGAAHFYRGDHFGEIVWAEYSQDIDHLDQYYFSYGDKDDINTFLKWEWNTGDWGFMGDLQVRSIRYESQGIDDDQSPIDIDDDFLFFNPKVGARYRLNEKSSVYAYAGMGSREPVRGDYLDANDGEVPEAEQLTNVELGYSYAGGKLLFNANGYYMAYSNQLVATGELNDVGAIIRENVGNSYRAGIELEATYAFNSTLSWNLNATFSQNKIQEFTEFVGDDRIEYTDTDISFSPSIIGASRILWTPLKNLELNLISKYVGDQYLDNTQSSRKQIDAYLVNDFRIAYNIYDVIFKRIEVNLLINNIFNEEYSSNGYTYNDTWTSDEVIIENFYYPQAGTNFLLGLNLMF